MVQITNWLPNATDSLALPCFLTRCYIFPKQQKLFPKSVQKFASCYVPMLNLRYAMINRKRSSLTEAIFQQNKRNVFRHPPVQTLIQRLLRVNKTKSIFRFQVVSYFLQFLFFLLTYRVLLFLVLTCVTL